MRTLLVLGLLLLVAASLAALTNLQPGGTAKTNTTTTTTTTTTVKPAETTTTTTTTTAPPTPTTTTTTTAFTQPPAKKPESLVEALNTFAVELYKNLYLGAEGNTLYSPFSVYSALLIAYEGMSGATRSETAQALRLPGDEALQEYQALLKALLTTQGNASLRVANALWVNAGFPLREDYVNRVRSLYGAEARNLDFAGDPEGSRRLINGWVENMTNRRIRDLLPLGSITPQTVMVITNAIHFKAPWLTPFTETFNATFRTGDGGEVQVEMMAGNMFVNLYEDDALLAVAIPYKGTNVSMVILMPKSGLRSLEEEMTWRGLEEILDELFRPGNKRYVRLVMPRFKISTPTTPLKEQLMAMGMRLAFTPEADFTRMSPAGRGIFIDNVYHKAYIDVNQWGTEAAAATAVVVLESLPPEVRIDQPFMFMLYDQATEAILFIGHVVDPAGQGAAEA